MHTKGMVFHGTNGRISIEIEILRNTIKYWNYIFNIFKNYSFIDKAGLFPDHTGIIWFNFFWIRGSFLKKLDPPIITNDRYYYEVGVIKNKNNENNCFNLLSLDLNRINPWNASVICRKNNINIRSFFNTKKYILKYPDLNLLNNKMAYKHFITDGINENKNLI